MSTGVSVITNDGLAALAEASAVGGFVKPMYFQYTSQAITAYSGLKASDIVGWHSGSMIAYEKINANTVEFTCDVLPDIAIDYTRAAALFLEDGTLFMVATPPYPFPPSMRQTFRIQLSYQNAPGLLDFTFLPTQIESDHGEKWKHWDMLGIKPF